MKISVEFTEDELEFMVYAMQDAYNESDRRARVALAQSATEEYSKEDRDALAESSKLWREEADIELCLLTRLGDKLTEMRQAK